MMNQSRKNRFGLMSASIALAVLCLGVIIVNVYGPSAFKLGAQSTLSAEQAYMFDFLERLDEFRSDCQSCLSAFKDRQNSVEWLFPDSTDVAFETVIVEPKGAQLDGFKMGQAASVALGGQLQSDGADGSYVLSPIPQDADEGVQPPCWNNRNKDFAPAEKNGGSRCLTDVSPLDVDRHYMGCTNAVVYSAMFPTAKVFHWAEILTPFASWFASPKSLMMVCVNSCDGDGVCLSEETFYWTSDRRQPMPGMTQSETEVCTVASGPDLYAGFLDADEVCQVPFRAFGLDSTPVGSTYIGYDAHDAGDIQWRTSGAVQSDGEGVSTKAIASRLMLVGIADRNNSDGAVRQYLCRTGSGADVTYGVALSTDWECYTGNGASSSTNYRVMTVSVN